MYNVPADPAPRVTTPRNLSWLYATIRPTGYNTFGIWWRHNPPGRDYSGPFATRAEATERAHAIAEYHGHRRARVTHAED